MLASGPPDPVLVEPAGLAGLRCPLLPTELPPDRRELVNLAGQAVLALQTQHYEEAESNSGGSCRRIRTSLRSFSVWRISHGAASGR